MRVGVCTFLALWLGVGPALADQTDPRLETLFGELRSNDTPSVEATVGRIVDLWSDSQSDTVDILFERARQSFDEGRFDLAAALLDHAVALSPSFAEARALRGAARSALNDPGGAEKDFRAAIQLEQRHFNARISLAEILIGRGEDRAAYAEIQAALKWNPHDRDALALSRALRDRLDGEEI